MTEKLYDFDGHVRSFAARVVSCEKTDAGFEVVLDRTAFFPNGGGQKADGGTIGTAEVLDVNENDGEIVHLTDSSLDTGIEVQCEIDWPTRFGRMQNHTGEHLICGIVHSLFGYENTGFHMGTFGVTADVSGPLTEEEVRRVEHIANVAVGENRSVLCTRPVSAELEKLNYRSKLDLTENVRIVTIDGYDVCACCAPHVKKTGEIGCVKILEHSSYKGGTRLLLKCGLDALEDYNERCSSIRDISVSLCAKENEVAQAVERLKDENSQLKYRLEQLEREKLQQYIKKIRPSVGNICLFADETDTDGLREIVNAGVEQCFGIFAAFGGCEPDFRYVLGSKTVDLRAVAKEMNFALHGRGGGKPNMVQGSVNARKEEIISFLNAIEL